MNARELTAIQDCIFEIEDIIRDIQAASRDKGNANIVRALAQEIEWQSDNIAEEARRMYR